MVSINDTGSPISVLSAKFDLFVVISYLYEDSEHSQPLCHLGSVITTSLYRHTTPIPLYFRSYIAPLKRPKSKKKKMQVYIKNFRFCLDY